MLVGGATRTPLVQALLQEKLQLDPRFEINPDLIVAMGASIQAGVIAGHKKHSILVDITPHTYSTQAWAGHGDFVCVPIIPRNTLLPASKSEMFFTVVDNQKQAQVQVYQGDNPFPEGNLFIGEFLVEGLSPVAAGNPIIIHYDLDLNGILNVTATEKSSGLAKTVTMDTRGQHLLNVEQARRNIASLIQSTRELPALPVGDEPAIAPGEPAPAVTKQLLSTAKDLRKRGEALLEKNITAEDAEEIRKLIHESALAIKDGNWDGLQEKNDALSDVLFYLED
jgi:molecular chaperone DnaK